MEAGRSNTAGMSGADSDFWGGPRDEPTPAEVEFTDALEERAPMTLDFWLHEDPDGTPWLLVSLTFSGGPTGTSVIKTLRLDFDAAGMRGGWSKANLNWDDGVRAEHAKVDFGPPDGIRVDGGKTPRELAQVAADWFAQHLPAGA